MSIFDDSVTLSVGDDSVQVSAYGAHILSWKVDNSERLWLSSLSPCDMSAPVRAAFCRHAAFSIFTKIDPEPQTKPHISLPRSEAASPSPSPSLPGRERCRGMALRGKKSGVWTKFAVFPDGASQHQ